MITKKLYMKRCFLAIFLFMIISYTHATDNIRLPDIRCMGMGMCGVSNTSLFNPALVSRESYKSISINYFNYYGLKELGTINAEFSYPNNYISAGANISSFGYDQYRISMFRLFTGKTLNEKWSIGVSLQYTILQTVLVDENPQYLSADIGLLFSPVKNLSIGMSIQDFPCVEIRKRYVNDIESVVFYSLQIGFEWEVINNMLIVGNVETDKNISISGRVGVEYKLIDNFCVRIGVRTTPLLPTFGIGYKFRSFVIDAAAQYHQVLGISTGIGVKYCL